MENEFTNQSLDTGDIIKIVAMFTNSDNVTILKHWIEPVEEYIGLCGDHSIIHVLFRFRDESKHATFFLKCFPRMPAVAAYAEGTNSFVKEIFIFQLFHKIYHDQNIKLLLECVPRCFLTVSKKLLVFENLKEDGYQQCNKNEYLDYATIKCVLEALAKLHASSLIYEEILSEKSGKPYRLIDEYGSDFKESNFNENEDSYPFKTNTGGINGILHMVTIFDFPAKLLSGKNFIEILEEVCRKPFELVKPSKKSRNVINHGDIWATNFMIKPVGDQKFCKLVDFQVARYVPPAQDVMAAIYLTTSRRFRREFMYDLVGVYYNYLEKYVKLGGYNLGGIIPFLEFLESCEEHKVFALVETAIYLPLVLLDKNQLEDVFGDDDLNRKAIFEDRSVLISKYIDQDENYIKRIKESMEDLKDYCDYL